MSDRVMLLALRRKWAALVFSGVKKMEIRRMCPSLRPPFRVMLYVCGVGVAGECRCDSLMPLRLDNEFLFAGETGVTRAEYWAYLAGARNPMALVLSGPRRYDQPVSLADLKQTFGMKFVAPQSWRYLTPEAAGLIEGTVLRLKGG